MRRLLLCAALCVIASIGAGGSSAPVRAKHGMVVSQETRASSIGARVLLDGGTAVDATVATAFALAVTHPAAGNIGGGGFLVFRPARGEPIAYDFRETAPARSSPEMFLRDGNYDPDLHHNSHVSVGIPGTVAGLHVAWQKHGTLPWSRLIDPAIALARDGFVVSEELARSLAAQIDRFRRHPASLAQFTKNGAPYAPGDVLTQRDLARTLERIAARGPGGFYEGETALMIAQEMAVNGGLITRQDLRTYRAIERAPARGTYRGYDVIGMPPISSGGMAVIQMLNVLEGYDLAASGAASAETTHLVAEAMRRAFADRARFLGDPAFTTAMPVDRLMSKEHAAGLRRTIDRARASRSSPSAFEWPQESNETTHVSVVDKDRNAVAMTYTLEAAYGSRIVVPGAGFLLNNEMGDFNAGPGLTNAEGLIGTEPNLAQPGKRMLSSMAPTILAKDGNLFMVTGSPGGRTIINTVLLTILNAVDFGMNAQEAVDAPRFHHQWLPDRIVFERGRLSPDTVTLLERRGHEIGTAERQGAAEVIIYNVKEDVLEAGVDRRVPDGAACGVIGPAIAAPGCSPF